MKIVANAVVSIHYELSNVSGEVLDLVTRDGPTDLFTWHWRPDSRA